MTWIVALDFASVFVFALTGALVASRAQLDPIGFAFFACLTAVGGGTLRDVLLDRNPVFWIANPTYIAVACGAAVVVFLTAPLMESRYNFLVWLDSFALAVAVAAGAGVALSLDQPAAIVVIMGIITGCMGGLMRDVVSNEVPLVLKEGELYVSAALAGAASAWIGDTYLDLGIVALALGAGVTWVLRAGSITFGWRLPTYKARPPRQ